MLVVVGAIALAASSGAFDSSAADRGSTVETASDGSALLSLDYPNGEQIELESSNSDRGVLCIIFGPCDGFRYNDVEIVVFADNTSSQQLTVEEIDISIDNTDMIRGDQLRDETRNNGNEINAVLGDFKCPAERDGLFSRQQTEDSGTVTVWVKASDGNVTVELERDVEIDCVQE
ncbi:hypothetical protein [Natrinema versiforme]|uniref:Uncharacterized protein n=1 Tax=Natrinema versiforme TaxID=88724 RepID=A0A4V1FXY0_9EURY|nr:hypothetical protein [Natrinema versiforme]QCS41131.1 hypothetical protein FEJ81_01750 [Natrinema versiforme]